MPWQNQIPQYMYNFQSPMQQMPPCDGYPFPVMQSVPPYYPSNMQWPPNMGKPSHGVVQESNHSQNQKSSLGKKEKSLNRKIHETPGEDRQTESSNSDSGSDSDTYIQHDGKHSSTEHPCRKKNRKKSSRTVVIRNINYITSKRRDGEEDGISDDYSSVEDEFIDGNSIKQKVDDALGSLEKHHKPDSCNYKKRGRGKNHGIVNKSNDASDQDHDNDLAADAPEGRKRNDNWDSFQNLLMRTEESATNGVEKQHPIDVQGEHFTIKSSKDGTPLAVSHAVDMESEKFTMKRTVAADSFVETERDGENEGRTNLEDFENGETFHPSMKKGDYPAEESLFSQRLGGSGSDRQGIPSDCVAESSIIKSGMREDWFIVNHSGKSEDQDAIIGHKIFDGNSDLLLVGDHSSTERSRKDVLIDDSFMVQSQSEVNDRFDSRWKTDISMVLDLNLAAQPENGTPYISQDKHGVSGPYEPDDLCMVPERDLGLESAKISWTPKMDYGIEISFSEADKKCSDVETNGHVDKKLLSPKSTNSKSSAEPGKKDPSKEVKSKVLPGSLGKNIYEIKSKKPFSTSRTTVQKSKLEKVLMTSICLISYYCFIALRPFSSFLLLTKHVFKQEEEIRKKMEEMLIQRQKRIAERSAASGFTALASKKVPVEGTSRPTTRETNGFSLHKPGITSSATDRLVSGQIKPKGGSSSSKSGQLKKTSLKVNGGVHA